MWDKISWKIFFCCPHRHGRKHCVAGAVGAEVWSGYYYRAKQKICVFKDQNLRFISSMNNCSSKTILERKINERKIPTTNNGFFVWPQNSKFMKPLDFFKKRSIGAEISSISVISPKPQKVLMYLQSPKHHFNLGSDQMRKVSQNNFWNTWYLWIFSLVLNFI